MVSGSNQCVPPDWDCDFPVPVPVDSGDLFWMGFFEGLRVGGIVGEGVMRGDEIGVFD